MYDPKRLEMDSTEERRRKQRDLNYHSVRDTMKIVGVKMLEMGFDMDAVRKEKLWRKDIGMKD